MQAAERQTGRTPPRLITPPVPAGYARHMDIWLTLHMHRGANLAGPARYTLPDLAAYTAITGDKLDKEDLRILSLIEEEFFASRAAAAERREKTEKRKGPPK